MKVNLRKIGAIVAGATILASSVAFAGLMFGSTQLVDANGAPVAKVVVGENAAAIDGLAAANIAAKIASAAFKTSTLTAQVAGVDSVSCKLGSGTGAASCAVSDKKVKLEVTVPGATDTSVYQLESLIGETTDRVILDRGASAISTYPLSNSETSSDANPFTDNTGSATANIGRNTLSIFRIDGTNYASFKDVTILDKDSGKSFKEQQSMWVKGLAQYKDNDDTVDGKLKDVIYQVKFNQDSYGMPVCDQVSTSDWSACAATSDHNLATHKIKMRYLNDDWVITNLDNTGVAVTNNEATVQHGGTVELSKEAVGGIINVGDSLDAGNGYKVTLDDIKSASTSAEQSAIISLTGPNGEVIKQTTIAPGTTQTLTTVAGGAQILVRVFKTAPGYTFGAKWADMSVLSNQITLKDGDTTVEVNGERQKNDPWTVALGWKNRDLDSAGNANVTDHLRTIVLYRDTNTDWLTPGNGVKIMENPVSYTLLYKGLNLDKASSDDYDTLAYSVSGDTFDITPDGMTTSITVNAVSYVDIKSNVDNAFTASAGSGNQLRLVFGNASSVRSMNLATAAISSSSFPDGGAVHPFSVLMKISSGKWVYVGNFSDTGTAPSATKRLDVSYTPAGSAQSVLGGGALFFARGLSHNSTMASGVEVGGANVASNLSIGSGGANFGLSGLTAANDLNTSVIMGVSEDVGESLSAQKPDAFAVFYDITQKSLNKDMTSVTNYAKDKVTWANAQNVSAVSDDTYSNIVPTTEEVNFITERGSIVTDKSDSSFTVKVAKRPAHAVFLLQPNLAAATTPGAQVFTGTEGDVFDAGKGVKVKVVSLTETVGACSVGTGAAPACTSDTSGVSAVIMPDNKASVVAGVPYGYDKFGPLVVLDKDAVGTDVLVTVGGPAVNSVTKEVLTGASVDFNSDKKVVKEVVPGKKIVVAGLTGDDTLDAAKDFISQLKSQ